MRHTKKLQRTVKADSRARLTLGLNFTPPGSNWRATRHPDGRITLEPLTEVEAPLALMDALAEIKRDRDAMFSDSRNEEEPRSTPDEQDSEHLWFTQTLEGVSTDCVRCGVWAGKVGDSPCSGEPKDDEARARKNLALKALNTPPTKSVIGSHARVLIPRQEKPEEPSVAHAWGRIDNADGTHTYACSKCGKFWNPTERARLCTETPEDENARRIAHNVKHLDGTPRVKLHEWLRIPRTEEDEEGVAVFACRDCKVRFAYWRQTEECTGEPLEPLRSYDIDTAGNITERSPQEPDAGDVRHYQP